MYRQKLVFVTVIFAVVFAVLSVCSTNAVNAASLTNASVTMSNSRMSFKAPISSGSAGSSLVTISGAVPDTTTRHLFPGDAVCFTDAGNNVCRDNKTYTVASVATDTTFDLSSTLTTALTATDYAVASQSGTWTITFTTVNAVPVGGKLLISIPVNDANTTAQDSDGMPDSSALVTTNGFDINKVNLTLSNATVTAGCTPGSWGTAGVANSFAVNGGGTTDALITWNRTGTTCAGNSAITVTITGPGLVNPAPITGHTQGTADIYGVSIVTNDGANTLDSATPRVAPVEAVLISATVDESLSFLVAAITGANLYANPTWCGTIPSSSDAVNTTATSIPWGHLGTVNHFYYAAQQLTVNTNAGSGYVVTIQENDQMGKNGNVCTNTSPSSGDYTFGTATCIRDTVCQSSNCTESTATDWLVPTGYAGLGYSEASQSGTDAPFYFNEKNRSFSAKQLADVSGIGAGAETPATIMGNSGPVSGSSIYVCYRITVPGTQPAGYYYNVAKYTATSIF
jgi:hypothetical protein